MKFINDYLAATNEETLQKKAIDPKSRSIWGGKGKFGDEDSGGFRLVLFGANDKYFDKSLPGMFRNSYKFIGAMEIRLQLVISKTNSKKTFR